MRYKLNMDRLLGHFSLSVKYPTVYKFMSVGSVI
jgi:hypothetical protein